MKEAIHPQWYPEAKVICSCGSGHVWTIGATVPEMRIDICSRCHPFFTGEQRIVDTEGQVDRFLKRLQVREDILQEEQARQEARVSPQRPMTDLGLAKRHLNIFIDQGIEEVGQFMERLEQGDGAILEIPGIGRKALADVKRELRTLGYELPEGT